MVNTVPPPRFLTFYYTVYSVFDILSSECFMLEYRWKVTWLSGGMLIWNCQQLFWRIHWLLWSLLPAECPNFDTESHGCGYLYILWENRFPPCNRFFPPLFLRLSQEYSRALEPAVGITSTVGLVFADCWCNVFSPVIADCFLDVHTAN